MEFIFLCLSWFHTNTDSSVYLGAIVNNLGGAEQDIRSRLGKAMSVIYFQSCVEQVSSAETFMWH